MKINKDLKPGGLGKSARKVFQLAGRKISAIDRAWNAVSQAPVFTVKGRYTARDWTQWTEGFQYGCALLTFDATGDQTLLELGRRRTVERMAQHVTHVGVHDHGFNDLSTYGNLRRLMLEGRIRHNEWELAFYDLAIKASASAQAARWTPIIDDPGPHPGLSGYIYSFNGPQSLFIDTMRTLRILGLAHQLGHVLLGEQDQKISLLGRLISHALTSAKYLIWYGKSRDAYDISGRTAHEAIFNTNNGQYRCPSSQQGYSPFSTWTRGLAWAMLGFAELLEYLQTVPPDEIKTACGLTKSKVTAAIQKAARSTCDFYLKHAACADGICYWDTGAPNLHQLGDYLAKPADPFNDYEPVDASASVIAAQGLIRLGRSLQHRGRGQGRGNKVCRYTQAGLTIALTLFNEPYLSTSSRHQGLLLHSVYHRPNGWDYIPPGQKVPCGESSMWGDYHLLELANLIIRLAQDKKPYPTFFDSR